MTVLLIGGGAVFTVNQNANSPERLLSLGEKYLQELDYQKALVQFLEVIEVEPMNPRGYIGAAEAYIGLGQFEEAETLLKKGLDALPDKTKPQL